MKKYILYSIAICLLLIVIPIQSNAATKGIISTSTEAKSNEAKTLLLRLDEINAMDKSNLKSAEKKVLRTEVRSIRSELREISGGGLYISAGAIIVILVLLLILF